MAEQDLNRNINELNEVIF